MAAGYGIALKAIAGGVQGYLSGDESNDQRAQILAAYAHPPEVPNLRDDYLQGFWDQQAVTPGLLANDRALRAAYGQQDAQAGLAAYKQLLPQYAQTNLKTLGKIDPQFIQGRNQLYGTVSNDLAAGSGLTPDMQEQIQQSVRGGQAARGNLLGNAPIAAEAFTTGAEGQQLKQQRISNMESFLRGPSPEDKFGQLAGAGAGGLQGAVANMSNPGFSYLEGPKNWAGAYSGLSQQQFQDANQQFFQKAQAIAQAPTEVNPWMASFAGGLGAMAGTSSGSGGGSPGGGMGGMGSMFGGGGGQNASWTSGYNSMMG